MYNTIYNSKADLLYVRIKDYICVDRSLLITGRHSFVCKII